MLVLFLKGLIVGLAIAAPVGPIGVLCIQRSLHSGFKVGLMTGLGAALADGTYGLMAGFGLTAISSILVEQQTWIRLLGGIFLFYLGIKTINTSPQEKSAKHHSEKSSMHALVTTYFLTLSNPMTILSFIGIFAGLGLGGASIDYAHAMFLVVGITVGSALWWLFLSGVIALILHHRMTPKTLRIINTFSGLIILVFGVIALLSLMRAPI